jgi:hypothetical protein
LFSSRSRNMHISQELKRHIPIQGEKIFVIASYLYTNQRWASKFSWKVCKSQIRKVLGLILQSQIPKFLRCASLQILNPQIFIFNPQISNSQISTKHCTTLSQNQCCGSGSESGSGSTCFWASRIRTRSISQRSGSGSGFGSSSGSFYHHAKIVRKTLIPTFFLLFLFFMM